MIFVCMGVSRGAKEAGEFPPPLQFENDVFICGSPVVYSNFFRSLALNALKTSLIGWKILFSFSIFAIGARKRWRFFSLNAPNFVLGIWKLTIFAVIFNFLYKRAKTILAKIMPLPGEFPGDGHSWFYIDFMLKSMVGSILDKITNKLHILIHILWHHSRLINQNE